VGVQGVSKYANFIISKRINAGEIVNINVSSFNSRISTLQEIHCWKGYRKMGTKMKGGKRVNNCVKIKEETTDTKSLKEITTDFLKYAKHKLGYKNKVKIVLNNDKNKVEELRAMACYSPGENNIWVYIGKRNTADILRSLGHELVHARQNETVKDRAIDGKTGSADENEANSLAGVMLREYGKEHPEIYN